MAQALIVLIAFTPCIFCLVVAGYLAMHGLTGWGWFLIAAVAFGSVSWVSDDKKDNTE